MKRLFTERRERAHLGELVSGVFLAGQRAVEILRQLLVAMTSHDARDKPVVEDQVLGPVVAVFRPLAEPCRNEGAHLVRRRRVPPGIGGGRPVVCWYYQL